MIRRIPPFFPFPRCFSTLTSPSAAAAVTASNSTGPKFSLSALRFDPIEAADTKFDKFTELTTFYTKTNRQHLGKLKGSVALAKSRELQNLVGHQAGFRRYLKVRGVGYKFGLEQPKKDENILTMNVGLSHTLKHELPIGMSLKFSRKYKMVRFQHPNLNILTGMAAYLRGLRKPDPYKGKGIRYRKDPVKIREGKKKKA